jgi:hypothetical protein
VVIADPRMVDLILDLAEFHIPDPWFAVRALIKHIANVTAERYFVIWNFKILLNRIRVPENVVGSGSATPHSTVFKLDYGYYFAGIE